MKKLVADATLLEYATYLPATEAIMLLDRVTYKTGSDYPENILQTNIGTLAEAYHLLKTDCGECDGSGYQWMTFGEEAERDICTGCWGSGKEQ